MSRKLADFFSSHSLDRAFKAERTKSKSNMDIIGTALITKNPKGVMEDGFVQCELQTRVDTGDPSRGEKLI